MISNHSSFTSEAKAFESLKTTADSVGAVTVSFNTTKSECSKVCKSPELADICENGATCKTRSGTQLCNKGGWGLRSSRVV